MQLGTNPRKQRQTRKRDTQSARGGLRMIAEPRIVFRGQPHTRYKPLIILLATALLCYCIVQTRKSSLKYVPSSVAASTVTSTANTANASTTSATSVLLTASISNTSSQPVATPKVAESPLTQPRGCPRRQGLPVCTTVEDLTPGVWRDINYPPEQQMCAYSPTKCDLQYNGDPQGICNALARSRVSRVVYIGDSTVANLFLSTA